MNLLRTTALFTAFTSKFTKANAELVTTIAEYTVALTSPPIRTQRPRRAHIESPITTTTYKALQCHTVESRQHGVAQAVNSRSEPALAVR